MLLILIPTGIYAQNTITGIIDETDKNNIPIDSYRYLPLTAKDSALYHTDRKSVVWERV